MSSSLPDRWLYGSDRGAGRDSSVAGVDAGERGAQRAGELLARRGVEVAEERVLDRPGERVRPGEQLESRPGGADDRAAPVGLVALALDQAAALELVDDGHDLRRQQPAQPREL